MRYDIAVIGSGPGGYVAAIRGAQLGKKVAIIERESLGGICLNWGCIPTKSLLRSVEVINEIKHGESFGVKVGSVEVDFDAIIARSRQSSETMSKGVKFLLDKAGVTIISGHARLMGESKIEVTSESETLVVEANDIIIATGARARQVEGIEVDNKQIISYRKALSMESLPSSMVVMGSGAIGSELAYFYHMMGCKVTLVEYMPSLMPNEDKDVSAYMERMMRKMKLSFMTSTKVTAVEKSETGCVVHVSGKKGDSVIECDVVLSAVGVVANIEDLSLDVAGVTVDKGRIVVDSAYQTSAKGIYAIGDVIPGYQLAHVASAEAVCAVEGICGHNPKPVNYEVIPRCVYTTPEVASIGVTEAQAQEQGVNVGVGKFPFTASGKATVAGSRDGFIKLIFDKDSDKVLGAHFVGSHVTEMISEISVAMNLGATVKDIINSVHPHPSLSESIMEAAAAAHGESVHI